MRSGRRFSKPLNFLFTWTRVLPSSLEIIDRSLPYIFNICNILFSSSLDHACDFPLPLCPYLFCLLMACSMVRQLTMLLMVNSGNSKLMFVCSVYASLSHEQTPPTLQFHRRPGELIRGGSGGGRKMIEGSVHCKRNNYENNMEYIYCKYTFVIHWTIFKY